MSTEEELKWMTRKWSWKYIPDRYQAMVATIVSALLYMNIFELLFKKDSDCGGTLLRPDMTAELGQYGGTGWIWNTLSTIFTLSPDLMCSVQTRARFWELVASFAALAICGVVLRRAIKRENATKAS